MFALQSMKAVHALFLDQFSDACGMNEMNPCMGCSSDEECDPRLGLKAGGRCKWWPGEEDGGKCTMFIWDA